jgi:hypothetical protein
MLCILLSESVPRLVSMFVTKLAKMLISASCASDAATTALLPPSSSCAWPRSAPLAAPSDAAT